jgi:hypothetical protein
MVHIEFIEFRQILIIAKKKLEKDFNAFYLKNYKIHSNSKKVFCKHKI